MRVRLIVNAAATGVRGPVLDAVIAALRDAAELEVVTTEYAGHATELAAAATEDAVVGLGGDGSPPAPRSGDGHPLRRPHPGP